jgi:hypothetical protein
MAMTQTQADYSGRNYLDAKAVKMGLFSKEPLAIVRTFKEDGKFGIEVEAGPDYMGNDFNRILKVNKEAYSMMADVLSEYDEYNGEFTMEVRGNSPELLVQNFASYTAGRSAAYLDAMKNKRAKKSSKLKKIAKYAIIGGILAGGIALAVVGGKLMADNLLNVQNVGLLDVVVFPSDPAYQKILNGANLYQAAQWLVIGAGATAAGSSTALAYTATHVPIRFNSSDDAVGQFFKQKGSFFNVLGRKVKYELPSEVPALETVPKKAPAVEA